jgi:glycosyltransferase involved in cell wall biosynthesis
MNVLALVPYPIADACTRYRIGQFVPALAAAEVHVTLAPILDADAFARLYRPGGIVKKSLDWLGAVDRRRAQIDTAASYDAVFLLRDLWPLRGPDFERQLFERTPNVVFDFDDAIFLPHASTVNRAAGLLRAPSKAAWLAGHARVVTPGNSYLRKWAEGHVASSTHILELPTAVDTERWRARETPPNDRIRLGWIGSHSTVPFLEALAPVLARLRARHPALRLVVIGATSDRFGDLIETVPWTLAGEVDALSRIDIGLAPLPDVDWSRGKCGLKLLQYLALEKPVVASAVGVHPAMVENGVQGFLADGEDAWFDALDRLIGDPALRAAMGQHGRARVEERYSVRAVAPRLLDALYHAAEAA